MKKTTQNNFSKRLAQYGALSVAIAGVADANGQIVYTDINPDEGGVGAVYMLDMDNDATAEFVIAQNGNNLFIAPIPSSAGVLGIDGTFDYPFALDANDVISSGLTDWLPGNGYYKTMNYNSCAYTSSAWCGVTDKYLGLRFNIGANTYYGWARLDAALGPSVGGFTIKDYAYNSTPGASILAGQTTLSIDESVLSNIRIVALNKSIALYNLPENTNYTLFSTSGQAVLNGSTSSDNYVIEANSVANGVYVLELNNPSTKAVVKKKIVL